MSKKCILLICLIFILFILIGCLESNIADVVIHLQQNHLLNSRSIAPENKEIAYYKISGFGPKGANFSNMYFDSGVCVLHSLPIGKWEFEAVGYNCDDRKIAKGSIETTVTLQNQNIELELDQLVGSGSLDLTFNWDQEQTYGLVKVELTLRESDETLVKTESKTVASASFSTIIENLDAGFYSLEAKLLCDEQIVAALVESVQIIDQSVSCAQRDFIIGLLAEDTNLTIIDKSNRQIEGSLTYEGEIVLDESLLLTYNPTNVAAEDLAKLVVKWYCDGQLLEDGSGFTYLIESVTGGTHRYDILLYLEGSMGSQSLSIECVRPITVSQ
jgi:hypothetical protein